MKPLRLLSALVSGLVLACAAHAGPYTDSLSTCLADSTTGKDRKDLARWVFAAISVHPELSDLSSATPQSREAISRTSAAIFTSLLTEKCLAQTRAAIRNEGPQAFQAAFGALGRLAMQELMTNPSVNASMSSLERYIDTTKLESLLRP